MRRGLLIPLVAALVIAGLLALSFLNQGPLVAQGRASITAYGPYVREYDFGNRNLQPMAIKADSKGYVWFVAGNTSQLFRLDPASGMYLAYKIPTGKPVTAWGLDIDARGLVWFTSGDENLIWSFNSTSGSFTSYPVPTSSAFPARLLVDKRGNIWFSEFYAPSVGFISAQTRRVQEIPVPGLGERAGTIELAEGEGRIWFAWASYSPPYKAGIGYVDLSTLTASLLTLRQSITLASGLGVGRDGRLWLVEHGPSLLISIDPASGESQTIALARGAIYPTSGNLPYWIIIRGDRVYLNEHIGNKMAYYDPSSGTLVEVILPPSRSGGVVNAVLFDIAPDGAAWFSELTEGKVGVVRFPDPLPFTLSPLVRALLISRGGQQVVPFTLKANEPVDLSLEAAGSMNQTGSLTGFTASFSQQRIALQPGQGAQLSLLLGAESKAPLGSFWLTLTAASQYLQVSAVLPMEVVP
jgi:virginiamycin B lyase